MQKAAKAEPQRWALPFLAGTGSVWHPTREDAEDRGNIFPWDFL